MNDLVYKLAVGVKRRVFRRTSPLTAFIFAVTDSSNGSPVQGAQCALYQHGDWTGEGVGGITDAQGRVTVDSPTFYPGSWQVYKAGYVTARGVVSSTSIVVALVPTGGPVYYWVHILPGVGGTTSPVGSFQVLAGSSLTVTAIPASGNLFGYWILNEVKDGSTNPITVTISKDVYTIRAVFNVPNTFKLTISVAEGQGSISPLGPGVYTINEGQSVTLTGVPTTGWQLNHWMLDGTSYTGNSITFKMDKDHTIDAYFSTGQPPLPDILLPAIVGIGAVVVVIAAVAASRRSRRNSRKSYQKRT